MALKTKAPKGNKQPAKGSDYDDTNRGVLFPNDKGDNENRPDYTGKINVDGVEKRLAAWVKNSAKIGDYLSISVSDPQES
jgi:uncharacterized protein (DUF736 family)